MAANAALVAMTKLNDDGRRTAMGSRQATVGEDVRTRVVGPCLSSQSLTGQQKRYTLN